MTTLHMEVEVARSTQSILASSYQELTTLLSSMTSTVNGLQPAWMGNSATQFFDEYEQWRNAVTQLSEQLNTLSTRLQNEINEWESAASGL